MCHISLNFQHKNNFLKLWKLTHEWCVQWNKGLNKHQYKIKTFGIAVKLVRKKKEKKSVGFK